MGQCANPRDACNSCMHHWTYEQLRAAGRTPEEIRAAGVNPTHDVNDALRAVGEHHGLLSRADRRRAGLTKARLSKGRLA